MKIARIESSTNAELESLAMNFMQILKYKIQYLFLKQLDWSLQHTGSTEILMNVPVQGAKENLSDPHKEILHAST